RCGAGRRIPTRQVVCRPARRQEQPFSRRLVSPYIFTYRPEANFEKTSMLNEVYNARILDLAGNIPRLGRVSPPHAPPPPPSKPCRSTVTLDLHMKGGAGAGFAHYAQAFPP